MTSALDEIASGTALPSLIDQTTVARPSTAALLREKLEAARQVEAARKAEADQAAALGQAPGPRPDKRDRASSANSASGTGKKAKNDGPTSIPNVIDMRQGQPESTRPRHFKHLYRLPATSCAISVEKGPIIGNPFKNPEGYDIKVSLDPGRYGQPSIRLDFRFSKDGTDSREKDRYNNFNLQWEPGVKIGVEWMTGVARICLAQQEDPTWAPRVNPAHIQELCRDEKNQRFADKLVCLPFESNVHRSTPVDVSWPFALKSNDSRAAHETLTRMYTGNPSNYRVRVWFLMPAVCKTYDVFWTTTALPFVNAAREHTPPLHRYLDMHGKPMMYFNLDTIDEIGHGMYRKEPKTKSGVPKPITYYNFDKTTRWDSITIFHNTHGIPIVRDMQFIVGLNAPI